MGIRSRVNRRKNEPSDEAPVVTGEPVGDLVDNYIGSVSRQIDGWLSADAFFPIRAVANHQVAKGITGGVAEIGVHHGQLMIYLSLLAGDGERTVGFDLFENQDENTDGSGEGDRSVVLANIAKAGADPDRIELVTANSLEVTSDDVIKSVGSKVRLFSVDGGHTPELTKNDLEIAVHSLTDGGVIILDDVFSQMWPGVGEGLRDFMTANEGALLPFGLVGNKTLLAQPEHQGHYLSLLDDQAPHFWSRKDSFYGADVRILLDPPG